MLPRAANGLEVLNCPSEHRIHLPQNATWRESVRHTPHGHEDDEHSPSLDDNVSTLAATTAYRIRAWQQVPYCERNSFGFGAIRHACGNWLVRRFGGGESRDIWKIGSLCIKRWSPRVSSAEARRRCQISRQIPATHDARKVLLIRFPAWAFFIRCDVTWTDLVHVFNMRTVDATLRQIRAVKRRGTPVVLSPKDAASKTIHVVLTVRDNGNPRLARYRRIATEGQPAAQ